MRGVRPPVPGRGLAEEGLPGQVEVVRQRRELGRHERVPLDHNEFL